ncbi:PREDICTED: protein ENHANCED DISEASE RESISTANCE 4-like [Tarenaya hassleriana]|uniref:protein ENHANCED DISEASE RESISTANCE 4-like n=1 Tax=Tarenaya hassleriana TaxID=28532 RepID=UPI00053C5457|nr:PREDICTED: protein ENHANCED DISEASE RESISTANCE 4-like [Tarenaya hassleriana]
MAESTKVRLVRCPKCENLLSEPEDCSVYQCGGCGAVLRAKNSDREADSALDKEDDRANATSVNSSNSTEKAVADSSEASDSDVPSNSGSSRHRQNGPAEACAVEDDPCSKMNTLDSGTDTVLRDGEDPVSQSGSEESGLDRFRKRTTKRNDPEGFRLSTSKFADEGPSNYFADSQKQLKDQSDEAIEQDRAGLLRKLDELKEQLARSCNVGEVPKEQVPSLSSETDKAPSRIFGPGKHSAGPSYYHHYPEPSSLPYASNHDISMHGLMYPSSHNPARVSGYGDPMGFQMHGRAPQPSHPYYSGQYVGNNHDLFEPYPQNGIFHQPSCSCFHCYDKYRRASAPVVPPPGMADVPYNAGFYPHESIMGFGPHNCNPRTFVPPPLASSRSSQAHARWPSDFVAAHTTNGLSRVRPPKVVLSGGSKYIRPLAGGAPFVTCQNCFELLKLPKKTDAAMKKQQKLRCGACSCLIDFSVVDKKFVISADREMNPAPTRDAETRIHRLTANFSSDDYDNAGYEFHSMDRESAELSTGPGLISDKPQELQNLHTSSPSVSEDELSSDSLIAKPLPPDSPFHDHFEYASINHGVHDRSGTGNRSSRSEQDKVTSKKTAATRQNSMKEASVVATEMDVSFNEFSHNSGVSQDSGIGNRGDDLRKQRKGGFASIVKKSFKDLTKSGQNEERVKGNVSVNGHPISERSVKKAEKQTGTIQPGNYWYDYRAGFWGVMGGPCLGIIPPFIEELNYPIPEDCASGKTAVYVNGRELHQRDLDLLAGRGLPPERHRSYIIDISGRVMDEDTGEELDSLGKLAPTIEKLKRGFGMKVPRRAS